MLRSSHSLAALALIGLAGVASAQTFRTVAFESFDLPPGTFLGNNGSGTGWASLWYSGGAGQDMVVVAPGFDAIGNLGLTNTNDGGSYRRLDFTNFPEISDAQFGSAAGPLAGKDGSILWISYETEIAPGSLDNYAGVSCFIFLDPNGVGEYLFMGTPYNNFTWGVDCPGCGGPQVGMTSALARTKLTYRIDFQAGMERVRMWTNPASAHPTTTPEVDTMVPDFRFNEMRIQSGLGGFPGQSGWSFDSLLVECQDCDPALPLSGAPGSVSVSAGGFQTMDLDGGVANANQPYLLLGSLSGTTPALPIDNQLLELNIDTYFAFTLNNPNLPPLSNSFGLLDAAGQAQAFFTMPVGANPVLIGITAHHAFAVIGFNPLPVLNLISNSLPLSFVP